MLRTTGTTAAIAFVLTLALPALGVVANSLATGTQDAKSFVKGFNKTVGETKKKLPMLIDDVTIMVDYRADATSKAVIAEYEIASTFEIDRSLIGALRDVAQTNICKQSPKEVQNWNRVIGLGWKMTAVYRRSGKTLFSYDLNTSCTGTGA